MHRYEYTNLPMAQKKSRVCRNGTCQAWDARTSWNAAGSEPDFGTRDPVVERQTHLKSSVHVLCKCRSGLMQHQTSGQDFQKMKKPQNVSRIATLINLREKSRCAAACSSCRTRNGEKAVEEVAVSRPFSFLVRHRTAGKHDVHDLKSGRWLLYFLRLTAYY